MCCSWTMNRFIRFTAFHMKFRQSNKSMYINESGFICHRSLLSIHIFLQCLALVLRIYSMFFFCFRIHSFLLSIYFLQSHFVYHLPFCSRIISYVCFSFCFSIAFLFIPFNFKIERKHKVNEFYNLQENFSLRFETN